MPRFFWEAPIFFTLFANPQMVLRVEKCYCFVEVKNEQLRVARNTSSVLLQQIDIGVLTWYSNETLNVNKTFSGLN